MEFTSSQAQGSKLKIHFYSLVLKYFIQTPKHFICFATKSLAGVWVKGRLGGRNPARILAGGEGPVGE
jgi:hypothetical protein